MMNTNKHPLDLIYERLFNGYYAEMPSYSFEKDRATVCYLYGYCSKAEYHVAKSKYDMFNDMFYWKSTSINIKKKGFKFGKTVRSYRIDSKWYDKKEDFIKALEKFSSSEFPNNSKKGGEK